VHSVYIRGMSHMWYVTDHCRKFIQMSYKFYGSGASSRGSQFIVHQCVHILYALRCVYIIHCLVTLPDWQVSQPGVLSEAWLNSQLPSAFTAIQNIKRPAKECLEDHHKQNVTWTNEAFTALQVHTGHQGFGRTPVSHLLLRQIFHGMVAEIRSVLGTLGTLHGRKATISPFISATIDVIRIMWYVTTGFQVCLFWVIPSSRT
jgi:hypothetical protein